MVMMLKLRLIRQSSVNSGQITTYPFKIDDEINIATTHVVLPAGYESGC